MSEQRSQVYIDKNVLSHLAGLDLLAAQWEADWQPTRKHSQRHMFIRGNIRPLDELWHLHKRGAIEFHLSTSLKVELERYANNALKAKQRAIFDTLQKIDDISLPMTGEHDVDGTHRLTGGYRSLFPSLWQYTDGKYRDMDDDAWYGEQANYDCRHLCNFLYALQNGSIDYFLTMDKKLLSKIHQHRLRPFAYDHLLQKRVYSPCMLLSLFTIS